MWYAVETVFIDGKLFGSRCCFEKGDENPTGKGHCLASLDKEPMNSCKKEFGDRIEIHVDWFETERLAEDFRDGKITYIHEYDTYYKTSIKSTLSRFVNRHIVDVDIDNGIMPHHGIYKKNKLDYKPYWVK